MLSQADRIIFSRKLVEAPLLLESLNKAKSSINEEKSKAQQLDDAHKNLVDAKTFIIDKYQAEIAKLDGYPRASLTEADQQDAANGVLGNSLYPNDPNNPPPSTAPMIWTKLKPYARNKAVGKFNNEMYGAQVDGEDPLIASIQSQITAIETTFADIERTTGQNCVASGTCSNPSYTNQTACVTNGFVWTPGPDIIATYPAVHTALSNLVSKVNDLKTVLLDELSLIYTSDPDPARAAAAQAAVNDINNNILPAINTWLALNDFDTGHGQTTCVGFYSYNVNLLGSTKLRPTELNAFKAAISARLAFETARQSQINSYLGTITQNLSTGDATGSGFYYERWKFIGLRLNILGGSLIEVKGLTDSANAQDQQIAAINSASSIYESMLKVSILAAPTNGTKFVQLKSATGFNVGDNIFIVADDQEEIVRTIEAIDGNRLTLGQPVPAKYRPASFARVYKDIS